MKVRNILSSGLLIVGLVSTTLSFAAPLLIINNTDKSSTSTLNHGKCSSALPFGYGVTPPHSRKEIPEMILGMACIGHSSDCTADIYMTLDCSGPKVGTVVLNTTTGIVSVTNENPNYILKGQGFIIQADPKSPK